MHAGERDNKGSGIMKNMTKLYLVFVLSFFMMTTAQENIAISGIASNSIALSTERSEGDKAYFLEINIEGIGSKWVDLETHGQKLILTAKQGNNTGSAIAGGQYIRYSFSYAYDADLQNFSRLNTKNKIAVTIPKY